MFSVNVDREAFTVTARRNGGAAECTVVEADKDTACILSLTTVSGPVGTRAGVAALVGAASICAAAGRPTLCVDDMSERPRASNIYARLGFVPAVGNAHDEDAWLAGPERIAHAPAVVERARLLFGTSVAPLSLPTSAGTWPAVSRSPRATLTTAEWNAPRTPRAAEECDDDDLWEEPEEENVDWDGPPEWEQQPPKLAEDAEY